MIQQINQHEWVQVKSETREEIRKLFGVPKSSSTQVETDSFGKSRVISDGCTNSDLQSLTLEKMTTYLGGALDTDTIHTLFEKVAAKIEGQDLPTPEPTIMPDKAIKKCEHCAFESASKFAHRMHRGRAHKNI